MVLFHAAMTDIATHPAVRLTFLAFDTDPKIEGIMQQLLNRFTGSILREGFDVGPARLGSMGAVPFDLAY